MIIVDTSIWADHFRQAVADLTMLVANDLVLQHPFVTGELAMGNPADRQAMIDTLEALPQAPVTGWSQLLDFAGRQELGGTGIGYVDAHLLASAVGHDGTRLWTRDKRLGDHAHRLGVAYAPK